MKITLIHNPKAGTAQPSAEALINGFKRAGHEVQYQPVKRDTFPAVLDDPADVIAVAGGDGTVRKVCAALTKRPRVPLLILPLGTANNIAKSLGLKRPWEETAAVFHGWRRRRFDWSHVRGTDRGGGFLLEAAGWGLFPEYMAQTEAEEKDSSGEQSREEELEGHLRAMLRLLPELPACELTVRTPEREESGRFLLAEAMNITSIGPNLPLCPETEEGDGKLEIVLIPGDRRAELRASLEERLRGGEPDFSEALRWRSGRVEILYEGDRFHIDDEPPPELHAQEPSPPARRTLRLEVSPDPLTVLTPA